MLEDSTIGHKHDHSFEELNDALFQATLNGDELPIRSLQETMRQRFGNLL